MPKISVIVPVYNLRQYLYDMLHSLSKQSFGDFEAIIIDDGSEDCSYDIIREFTEKDSRFKAFRQQNNGVSAARNRGMDIAEGEYIIFFDGDDYIPVHALKSMYSSITAHSCDMAVGIMKTYDSGTLSTNMATKRLAEKVMINACDRDFIKTWSQCNKMYRLDFLRTNHIRFMDVKVAEDGHFLYQALSKAEKICGCNETVYHYIRRASLGNSASASKNVDMQFLYDRIRVYDDIIKFSEELLSGCSKQDKARYRDMLISRFISGGMIQAFYKRIWRCRKGIDEILNKYIAYYKRMLSDEAWEAICHENWEINPDRRLSENNGFDFRNDIIKRPEVTIAVSDEMDKYGLDMSVAGFYNQEFPSFELILSSNAYNKLDDALKSFENIRVYNKNIAGPADIAGMAKGRYVFFAEDPVILNTGSLKKMADRLEENDTLDFVSVYAEGLKGYGNSKADEEVYKLKCIEAVFGYTDKYKRRRFRINLADSSFSNKLFRREAVTKLSDDIKGTLDIGAVYSNMSFEKSRSTKVLIAVNDELLLRRGGDGLSSIRLKAAYMENKIMGVFAGKGIKKRIKRLFSRG